ncbi:MAG: TetR/AcrR family transcriptional regulator [Streptosporangiaceae bacterium]
MTVSSHRRLPRQLREQQMLDAAVRIFSEHGFHGASMDEIAELAGVSKPLLYMYLGSKDETFSACIARESGRLVETIGAAIIGDVADPAERLWRGLTAFFTFVAEHRASWIVLYQQARSHSDAAAEQLAAVRKEIIDTVAGLVLHAMAVPRQPHDEGARTREAAAIAHTIVGAADAMAEWALTVPGEQPETTARRLMGIIWVGLDRSANGERFTTP